jgi:hypothetical protein
MAAYELRRPVKPILVLESPSLSTPSRMTFSKSWESASLLIDCFSILDDRQTENYFELGCEGKGLSRGHIQRIKKKVRSRKR